MSVVFFTPPEHSSKVNPISAQSVPDQAPSRAKDVEAVLSKLGSYRSRPWRGFNALRKRPEVCTHPEVAATLVDCALVLGRLDVAEEALEHVNDTSGLLEAQYHMAKDAPDAALAALKSLPKAGLDRTRSHGIKTHASALVGEYAQAVAAAHDWARDMPDAPQPYTTLAKALAKRDDPRAADWFDCALFITGGGATERLNFAEYLIKKGEVDAARAHLEAVTNPTGRTARRKARIMRTL